MVQCTTADALWQLWARAQHVYQTAQSGPKVQRSVQAAGIAATLLCTRGCWELERGENQTDAWPIFWTATCRAFAGTKALGQSVRHASLCPASHHFQAQAAVAGDDHYFAADAINVLAL